MDGNILLNDDTLSMEMITPQLDDKVIKLLEGKFEELISNTDRFSNTLVVGSAYYKNKTTKGIIADIDKIISKRFGFKMHHTYSAGIGYAVYTAPPANDNVLKYDAGEMYKMFKMALEADGTKSKDVKRPEDIYDLWNDADSLVYRWVESVNALEKTLNTDGVKVNLKKANISNLPKEYTIFIASDFTQLIRGSGLTARELTAVLLHEIGHAFTHLEYSYRTVRNTSVLVDTLKYNIGKKGKSMDDTIRIVYKDVLKGDVKDLSNTNSVTATVRTLDKYMSITNNVNSENAHTATDSEMLADQFTGRFGLSMELAQALTKFDYHFTTIIEDSATLALLTGAYILLFTASIAFAIVGALAMIFLELFVSLILPYILDVVLGGTAGDAKTYDDLKRRYVRMRNEVIRQLRSLDLDKNSRRAMINSIDVIDDIIANTGEETRFTEKLANIIFPWQHSPARLKELDQLIEDTMENNLHIGASRLKTLI